MKRALSVILIAVMLTALPAAAPLSAYASDGPAETDAYSYTVNKDGTATIMHYFGDEADVTIPSALDGHKVVKIASSAFYGRESLTSVVIPDTVTDIAGGYYYKDPETEEIDYMPGAFAFCPALTDVYIGRSVSKIGDSAFRNCPSLTGLTVAQSNRVFDSRNNCSAVIDTKTKTLVIGCKATVIPDTVTAIGDNAFRYCTALRRILIPGSVSEIGAYAFDGCTALKSVVVPATVRSIGRYAFGYQISEGDAGVHYYTVNGFTLYGYKGSAAESYARNSYEQIRYANIVMPYISRLDNTDSGVRISWSRIDRVCKYRVFVRDGNRWRALGDTAGTSFVHKAAQSGVNYTYTVRCITANGKRYLSNYYAKGWSTTYIGTPKAPVLKNTANGIQISWHRVAGAANYRIFRKTGGGNWVRIADTNRSYLDTTAQNGVTYTYTVRCLSADGKSFTGSYNKQGSVIRCSR